MQRVANAFVNEVVQQDPSAYLSPSTYGGLGFGNVTTSVVFLVVIVALVSLVSVGRNRSGRATPSDGPFDAA